MLEAFASLDDWRSVRERLAGEHVRIGEAIEAHDAEGAASAAREHVRQFYRHVVAGSEGDETAPR
jgi:DNA-binding GntR family transcriptional regulator